MTNENMNIINQIDFGNQYIIEILASVDTENASASVYTIEYGLGKVAKATEGSLYKVGDVVLWNARSSARYQPFTLNGKRYVSVDQDYAPVKVDSLYGIV